MISQFPTKVGANQELLQVIKSSFSTTFRYIMFDRLKAFFEKIIEGFFEDKYTEVGDHLLEAINALSETFNPRYVATQMLFEANESKVNRFKLYSLMTHRQVLMVKSFYADLMIAAYSDASQNTDEENALITEMQTPEIPPNA